MSSLSYECEYCNKQFSSKSNLNAHQKSAKYCLEKQGKDNPIFDCEYCKRSFRVKQTLIDHYHACKEKQKQDYAKSYEEENKYLKQRLEEKDEYIEKLESTIEKYEEKLEKQKAEYEAKLEKFENAVISVAEASKQPNITYNSNSNNGNQVNNNQILNLSPDVVEPLLREKLTFEIAKQGQKGLASFVLNNMLKGPDGELKYKCKDTARQNFEYINKHGDVEKDVRAKKLSQALIDSKVEKIAGEVGVNAWRDDNDKYVRFGEKVSEIVTLSADDTTFRNTLTQLTS